MVRVVERQKGVAIAPFSTHKKVAAAFTPASYSFHTRKGSSVAKFAVL